MKRVMCVWFPNWPVQRWRAAHAPERRATDGNGRETALALYAETGGPRGATRVVACSASAAEQGILPGMSVAEATALASGGSEQILLECVPHDPHADREALEKWGRWLTRFSPFVALEEAPTPEGVLLDVTGCERLFGGEAALATEAAGQLRAQGLDVRMAISETLGASWAIAHYACDSSEGWRIVPSGQVRAALRPLPIEALRLPDEPVRVLRELGIVSIGQLEQAPRDGLCQRFGAELLDRLDQAWGILPETLPAAAPPAGEPAEWSFETPTERNEELLAALERLLERVLQPLARRRQGVRQLQCRLEVAGGAAIPLEADLCRPSDSVVRILGLLRLRLEATRLTGPVRRIRLRVTASGPLEWTQASLFTGAPETDWRRNIGELIELLVGRLGRQAVLRARLDPDAQPEYACRLEPLLGAERSAPRAPSPIRTARRPTHLYRRPAPIDVTAHPDGVPRRLVHAGQAERLTHAWGPERIETGWWRGRTIRRDYYIVETGAGARLWIFQRLTDRRWFLHGSFD